MDLVDWSMDREKTSYCAFLKSITDSVQNKNHQTSWNIDDRQIMRSSNLQFQGEVRYENTMHLDATHDYRGPTWFDNASDSLFSDTS